MSRAFLNLKKKGSSYIIGDIEARIASLEARWNAFEARHDQLLSHKRPQDESISYFKQDVYSEAEEVYLTEKAKFLDALNSMRTKTAASNQNINTGTPRSAELTLPAISLLHFAGKYSEWNSFKDLFLSLVEKYDNIRRLHYLKVSVTREAAKLIQSISVKADNYERAWNRLTEHYENKRTLIKSCLDAFFQLKPMTKPMLKRESHYDLKQLRDGTFDCVETLEILQRPAKQMEDIICYMTVMRLDSSSRRDWEISLGSSSDPITWENLDKFLLSHIQALVGTESAVCSQVDTHSSHKKQSSQERKNGAKFSAHNATKQKSTCSYCKQDHYIAFCDKFRSYSPDYNRSQFVSENRLCLNCLGHHLLKDCRSKRTCREWNGRHHSLLHKLSADSTLDSAPTTPVSTSQDVGVTSHTTKTSLPQSYLTLLATAEVRLTAGKDRSLMVRALIDPCSEVSFISECAAQTLRLPRQSVFVRVSGVGGKSSQTARTQATILISPHFNYNKCWTINALILPLLTDYLLTPQRVKEDLSFAKDICLADPDLPSTRPIDLIIGDDLILASFKKGYAKAQTKG